MRHPFWICALALCALSGAASAAPNTDPWLLLEKEALILFPPRLVTTGMVGSAEWSPDGKYVLAFRSELPYALSVDPKRPPLLRRSLVLWSASTGNGKELWSQTAQDPREGQFVWLSRSSAALVLLNLERPVPTPRREGGPPVRMERWLYRLDPKPGVLKPLTRVPDDAHLAASPIAPSALLWSNSEQGVKLVRENGTVASVSLPEGSSLFPPAWEEGGRRAAVAISHQADAREKVSQRWVMLDPSSGTTAPLEMKALRQYVPPTVNHPIRVKGSTARISEMNTVSNLQPLWLESVTPTERQHALISPSAEWGKLSPSGDAVLFVDDRGAWAVKPMRLPKEAFFQAREAAQRSVLLSHGKQLAVGLLMYAQDNDERLPGAGEPIQELIMPYLKNEALFQGFVYTFQGGQLADIAMPAETVIGHIPGPGGRALVYADGHVVWDTKKEQ